MQVMASKVKGNAWTFAAAVLFLCLEAHIFLAHNNLLASDGFQDEKRGELHDINGVERERARRRLMELEKQTSDLQNHASHLQMKLTTMSSKDRQHSHDEGPVPIHITPLESFVAAYNRSTENPIRVCLVSSAIAGPTPNGGIGTVFYALARHLADANNDKGRPIFYVTILYAAHPWYGAGKADEWINVFAEFRVRFVPLPPVRVRLHGPNLVKRAYRVYEYLRVREHEYDVISYHDFMGVGYYVALAKHLGLNFGRTILHVQCHSTLRWSDELNRRGPKDHNTLAYYHMEQKSVELADVRVSPSLDYIRWLGNNGHFNLSQGTNIIALNTLYPVPARSSKTHHKSQHLVFFGRLEVRKGLFNFLDAIDLITANNSVGITKVSFLGPNSQVGGITATEAIRNRAKAWPFEVYVNTSLNSSSALAHIRESGGIVVNLASKDNSPYAIMEIIASGLPLIMSRDGGGIEMIKDQLSSWIVDPKDTVGVADTMARAVTKGIETMEIAFPFHTNVRNYIAMFRSFPGIVGPSTETRPIVSPFRVLVGITGHNRPDDLVRAVKSIISQTYSKQHTQLLIVDDASNAAVIGNAFAHVRRICAEANIEVNILMQKKKSYVSVARNQILQVAQNARHDFVCFMDDDDVAHADMLATYMRAARASNADVLTDISDNYNDMKLSHRSLAVGNAFAHNFFVNDYGKANFCTRPAPALEMGGHDTSQWSWSPYVDWDFFTRASLRGLQIELVPLPLYSYTMNSANSIWYGMTSESQKYEGHRKMIEEVARHAPPALRDILMFARFQLGLPKLNTSGIF